MSLLNSFQFSAFCTLLTLGVSLVLKFEINHEHHSVVVESALEKVLLDINLVDRHGGG